MSENGPREGTRDLPRRDRDAGHRSVDPGSPAGLMYDGLARRERRRREEVAELVADGLGFEEVRGRYQAAHPADRELTRAEFDGVAAVIARGPRDRRKG
jgi:hypothetical protein